MITKQSSTTNTLKKNGILPTRKRTHLSQNQISALQASFSINPLPDATIRHGLSLSLGITERTVQIWFQNRRAKARKLEDIANGKIVMTPGGNKPAPLAPLSTPTTSTRYQATFRSMMTPQLFEEMNAPSAVTSCPPQRRPRSASKPEQPKPVSLAPRFMSEDINYQQGSSSFSAPRLDSTITLPVDLLRIGSWTRFANMGTSDYGLIGYSTSDHLIWQIQSDHQQFRIHLPFDAIHQLVLTPDARLIIHLDPQQLIYTMCLQQEWIRCADFTESNQASLLPEHEIHGDMLQHALLSLVTAVPGLASKLVLVPFHDSSQSPSATPEPLIPAFDHPDKAMVLQAPFYYHPYDHQLLDNQLLLL